ncbi:replicative DNA helicase [Clostridium sp.]|uniref:replicative DNA helicase n=1 Tax=Clostridium sp. TaxID=1506 RepID=UPI0032170348
MDMVMPHSMEAEQVVLGVIINDKEKIYEVEDILNLEDFYYENHREIYRGVLNLRTRDTEIDLITLSEELRTRGILEKCNGITYLSELSNSASYLNNIRNYSEIIIDKASRRKVIKACMKAIDESHKDSLVEQVVEGLEDNIHKAYSSVAMEEMEPIMDTLQDTITHIEGRYLGKKEIEGIPTGYKALDKVTSGLQPGDLVIIAARPSMGKTALALNIAQYVSKEAKVGLFSLEMSKNQLMQRMLAAKCLIPLSNIKSGKLTEANIQKLMEGAANLAERKIFIDDTSTTIANIRGKAKTLKHKEGLDVLIIDYLQLIESVGVSNSREQEVAKISRELKRMAKSLKITVIALAQLSRASESRRDPRPMLSDLRESGSIEQDADIVIFPYREVYYDKELKEKNQGKESEVMEIIVGKNRNGEVKTVNLGWIGKYQRVVEI